ncbi:unnamed protein product, partial [Staurois parvus]
SLGSTPYPPPSTVPWFHPLPTSEHRPLHRPLVPPPTHLRALSLGSTPDPPLSTVPWFHPLPTSEHCPLVPPPTHL